MKKRDKKYIKRKPSSVLLTKLILIYFAEELEKLSYEIISTEGTSNFVKTSYTGNFYIRKYLGLKEIFYGS